MSSQIIDVKTFSTSLRAKVKDKSKQFFSKTNLKPSLAVVLVGDNPASQVYVKQKIKACNFCEITSKEYRFDENLSQNELIKLIESLNNNPEINGILVQLPLPKHIDERVIINTINPIKDVDGFHTENIGKLHSGQNQFVPCTPLGVIMLLEKTFGDLSGKNAVVIGRSLIVGRPMFELLVQKNCTTTIVHSKTKKADFDLFCKNADIVIAAVGIPRFIKKEHIKKGAVVIDVGINRIIDEYGNSLLVGDVDFANVRENVSAITTVPGGVGLLTVSLLMINSLKSAYLQHKLHFDFQIS